MMESTASPMVSGNIQSGHGGSTDQSGVPQKTLLQQSAHPTALIFHLLFRTAALLIYFFGGWISLSYVFSFVVIVILLAVDFWTVKNVTGRLLVGLRWWNEVHEDGSSQWIFESRPDGSEQSINAIDSRIFWGSMYLTPVVWLLFGFLAIFNPANWSWLLVVAVAIVLNMANVVGYTKCEKDAKSKVNNFISGHVQNSGFMQSMVSSVISSRVQGLFGGAAAPAQQGSGRY
ncbi:MAG: hypothetical protein SGCHY_000100 [Lobulomycetales sp.]